MHQNDSKYFDISTVGKLGDVNRSLFHAAADISGSHEFLTKADLKNVIQFLKVTLEDTHILPDRFVRYENYYLKILQREII